LNNFQIGDNLPDDIKKQMHEYALKLDQIRKSFESANIDVSKLSKVEEVGKKVKNLGIKKIESIKDTKISPKQVKEQLSQASKSLEALMKKMDKNGFLFAQTLLNLDLLNLKSILSKNKFNINKGLDLVKKMDLNIKQVEEQLQNNN
jgi:hypothetical protein